MKKKLISTYFSLTLHKVIFLEEVFSLSEKCLKTKVHAHIIFCVVMGCPLLCLISLFLSLCTLENFLLRHQFCRRPRNVITFKVRALEKTLGNNYLRKTLRKVLRKACFYKMSTFPGGAYRARLQDSHVCGQKGYHPCCYNNQTIMSCHLCFAL